MMNSAQEKDTWLWICSPLYIISCRLLSKRLLKQKVIRDIYLEFRKAQHVEPCAIFDKTCPDSL